MDWIYCYTSDLELRDFAATTHGRTRILARRGYEKAVLEIAPEIGRGIAESRVVERTVGGRGGHPVIRLDSGEKVLVRRYQRGGAVRHVNRETYLWGNRAMAELRATVAAARRGASVPVVLAAIEHPRRVGYRADLIVRWIDGAVELATWMAKATGPERGELLREVGRQIGRLHDVGIAHPDLNLRNLLVAPGVQPEALRVVIIDFDRGVVRPRPISRLWRGRDLLRLARSARKLGQPMEQDEWGAVRYGYGPEWPLA